MLIGVPKEIKNKEFRVGMTPTSVREVVAAGHKVMVETGAGAGIGMSDADYRKAGAKIIKTPEEIFAKAEMIVKVKEPQANERKMLREGQILFTYLHLAPDPAQTKDLVKSKATCIAYETVTSPTGGLPLLAPMSEVAGRLSIQAGAYYLEKAHGGHGLLLGGVPGVDPAKVVVIGGGVVGRHAIHIALGMGADVWVIDKNVDVLRSLWAQFDRPLNTVYSTRDAIERHCAEADLVIGGVLIPGAAAPKLITRDIVKSILQEEPEGLDWVFECAGEQETLDQAIELLKPGGTLLTVGIQGTDRVSFHLDPFRRKEIRVQNVRRQNACTTPAIDLVAAGKAPVDRLVTHHFPLEQTKQALDLVAGYEDGVVKAIVQLSPESQESFPHPACGERGRG